MPQQPGIRPVTPRFSVASAKEIWLTFDDGPHPVHTKKVVETLKKHDATATFFVIGRNGASYPQTLKLIADGGHRVANHTWNHPKLTTLTKVKVKEEILKTEKLLLPFMHGKKLFRPPYGAHNAAVDAVVAELGYRLVIWNVDTVDWSKDFQPDKWVDHGIRQIKARQNSVVLNHDIWRSTATHLDAFLTRVKAIRGASFKPADTL
jgi:peptidoglycan-N-acetylglucosamine deacetylase